MTGDEAFDRDLRRWVRRFYEQRERLAAERSRAAVERLFDRERRLLTGLAAQLMLAIALLPWSGVAGVIAGLTVLYLGTMLSGAWTLRKERALTATRPPATIEAEAERAVAACPALDPDSRALLVRLMNLAQLRPTPRGLDLLRAELRESLTLPTLACWPFLHELSAAFDGPDSARLGTLGGRLRD